MKQQEIEKTIAEYLKPIFGFTLKRCKNIHDAEDLSQDIMVKIFRAMLLKDDIEDIGKFIWTIAHNSLSNYYRDAAKSSVGVSLDEISDIIPDTEYLYEEDGTKESIMKLRSEIAYLSRIQRKIVIAYYFENKKQSEIATELSIPIGSVKWHLFEARKELKRGMNIMRKASDLKFNPINFNMCGIVGSVGTEAMDKFFRSSLSQNICYCIRDEAKTVNEIADDLGVSPVYIESEVEHLEKYGYLSKKNEKYIINFLIVIPTSKLLEIQNSIYRKAAKLLANKLYDKLISSRVFDDKAFLAPDKNDLSFIMWSIIPYIVAESGEELIEEKISFKEVATIRPDGSENFVHATVSPNDLKVPEDYVNMHHFCGPARHHCNEFIYWTFDSKWSEKRLNINQYDFDKATQMIKLYKKSQSTSLSIDDLTWLAENGYVRIDDNKNPIWQIVILGDNKIKNSLIDIGTSIKQSLTDEFIKIKAPYEQEYYNCVPKHMKKIAEYQMQHVFNSDGNFIMYCLNALLENGKLQEPNENHRKTLSILITPN